jgi:Uma2 family endonuclease
LRLNPPPGTATEDDVETIHDREHRLYELVDGILVEKTMGQYESAVALRLAFLLMEFLRDKDLGTVFGADGMMKLAPGLVRIPDVSFVSHERLQAANLQPHSPLERLVPDLAVEVLSAGNTREEMDEKLQDYFDHGVRLVWYVDPQRRVVSVYEGPDRCQVLAPPQILNGEPVLPGLTIPLTELFAPFQK